MIDLTVSAKNDDVDEGGMSIAELEVALQRARDAGAVDSLQPVVRVHRTGFVKSVSVQIDDDEQGTELDDADA